MCSSCKESYRSNKTQRWWRHIQRLLSKLVTRYWLVEQETWSCSQCRYFYKTLCSRLKKLFQYNIMMFGHHFLYHTNMIRTPPSSLSIKDYRSIIQTLEKSSWRLRLPSSIMMGYPSWLYHSLALKLYNYHSRRYQLDPKDFSRVQCKC